MSVSGLLTWSDVSINIKNTELILKEQLLPINDLW